MIYYQNVYSKGGKELSGDMLHSSLAEAYQEVCEWHGDEFEYFDTLTNGKHIRFSVHDIERDIQNNERYKKSTKMFRDRRDSL